MIEEFVFWGAIILGIVALGIGLVLWPEIGKKRGEDVDG